MPPGAEARIAFHCVYSLFVSQTLTGIGKRYVCQFAYLYN
jgi:hypothetical protein